MERKIIYICFYIVCQYRYGIIIFYYYYATNHNKNKLKYNFDEKINFKITLIIRINKLNNKLIFITTFVDRLYQVNIRFTLFTDHSKYFIKNYFE